jgi:hypothetical protein
MKRLMTKFALLDSYWGHMVKTTIDGDNNTIRFQLKVPGEDFEVHEYRDFTFLFDGDNVSIKYRDNPLAERHSDVYNVNDMSILLDGFIEKVKNEEHLCGELFLWHLSEIFGLKTLVFVGLAEGTVIMPTGDKRPDRDDVRNKIRDKLLRNNPTIKRHRDNGDEL